MRAILPPLLAIIALFLTLTHATHPFAQPQAHQHEKKQLAQGGGIVPATIAAVQYPVVSNVASLVTVGGVTTVKQVVFTQTFASTALGSWDIGPTPLVGSIGLGDIQGTVGVVGTIATNKNNKRALETPAPLLDSRGWWRGR